MYLLGSSLLLRTAAAARQPAAASLRRSMGVLDKAKDLKDRATEKLSSDEPPSAPSNTEELTAHATSGSPSEAGLFKGENTTSARGTAFEETGGQGQGAHKGIPIEQATKGQDVLAEGAKDKPSKQ